MKDMVLSLAVFLAVEAAAWAEPVRTEHALVDLLVQARSTAPGVPFFAGVRIRLDPGWHTYWINPGEAGMETRVKWDLPPGFSAGPLQWPYPKRFVSDGVIGFGYESEVVLVSEITPPADLASGSKVSIGAAVDLLLCEQICVPGSAQFARELAAASAPADDEDDAKALREAAARVPQPLPESVVSARFSDGRIVIALEGAEFAGARPDFFPEARNLLALDAEPAWIERAGGLDGQFVLSHLARGTPFRLRGVLVWERGGKTESRQVDVRLKR